MSGSFEVQLRGLDGTERWGRALAEQLEAGDVVLLEGDLGSGKTTMARAIAYGLGVPASVPVTSPTFALLHEYTEGRIELWHADVYRLSAESDLEDLGLADSRARGVVLLVEWGTRFPSSFEPSVLTLRLEAVSPDDRLLRVDWRGNRGERLAEVLSGAGPVG